MPTPRIAAEFTGDPISAFLEGVPARDLTADELDALPEDRRTLLLANAASDHAVYTLHGRDLKAEAKEVAADPTPPGAPALVDARPSSKEGKAS